MNYYNQIRNNLIDVKINNKVKDYSKNKYQLEKYFEIGKLLIEAQGGEARAKYGDSLIKEYSKRLTEDLGKGYSVSSLKYMREFYIFQKGQPLADQLSWSHYQELLPLKDSNEINYYVNSCIKNNLSRNKLRELIKSKEYERLPETTKEKLINNETITLIDTVKDPVIINTNLNVTEISEKVIHELIIADLDNILIQLGEGYSYIKHEYPIKMGNNYNYIDFLFFNYKYNAFVVIEVKVTKLKKEHIGQVETYMNYVDNNLKSINQSKTIGIIMVQENDKYIMKYCSNPNIKSIEFVIGQNIQQTNV